MYLFDFDGTLVDSNGVWVEIDNGFLARRGLTPTREYSDTVGHSIFPIAAQFTKDYYCLDMTPEAIRAEWLDMARDAYARQVPMKPGAEAFLARCAAALTGGVLLSLLIVVFCWKPYFLFRRGLKENLWIYVRMYAKHILLVSAVSAVMYLILGVLPFDPTAGIGAWLMYGVLVIGIFFSLLFGTLYIAIKGMRIFVRRCQRIIR